MTLEEALAEWIAYAEHLEQQIRRLREAHTRTNDRLLYARVDLHLAEREKLISAND